MCLSCTVNDIFSVEYWRDLEIWLRNYSQSMEYEFLFVFHCNNDRILYRFQSKARYCSKNANFSYYPFHLTCTIEPFDFFHQNFNTNYPSPSTIRWCKNIDEKFKPLSGAHERHRQTTDKQTDDRRTAHATRRT